MYLRIEDQWSIVATRPSGLLEWADHSAGERDISDELTFVQGDDEGGNLRVVLGNGAPMIVARPVADLEPLRRAFETWVRSMYEG